jgi:DNA-binding transcriptional LysR family regulator
MQEDFSLSDAKFICAVKELGTSAAVSKFLGLSQSSIGVYVQRIEKRMGKKIFARYKSSRKIELTPDGIEIYPTCRKILDLSHSLNDLSGIDPALLQGEVKLTGTGNVLLNFCLPYLADFSDKYPKVEFFIRQQDNMMDCDQELNEFFFTTEVEDDGDAYAYFPYHTFVQKLWASPGYLAKHGQIKNVQDLYRHTLLFQKGIIGDSKVVNVPPALQPVIDHQDIRPFHLIGTAVVDFLCENGFGIMNGSEETTRLGNLKVVRVLDGVEGVAIKTFIKVCHQFISKKIGKLFLNWLFESRDKALAKVDMTPVFEFKPFKV